MASKDVAERRLRPIYDLIDNMNNKKALQEIDKLLKKQPNFQTAKALKALTSIRMEKFDDANSLIDKIMAEDLVEETALQPLTMCFRETNKPEMICQVYEKIIKKEPANEEYLTHLFMAYVRIGDYKNQQRIAMALYKCKPKNPYYFWAVMSVVMQSKSGDPKLARGVTLPLAERMAKKAIDEGRMEAEPEVLLYLMILELQEKFPDILATLDSPLGEKLIHESCAQRKAEVCLKLSTSDPLTASKALEIFKDLLKQNPDRFDYYEGMFEAVSVLRKSGSPLDDTGESLLLFIDGLKTQEKVRGPYLAKLLLVKVLGYESPDLLSWFADYVKYFGDKPCAFTDLKPFLGVLDAEQQKTFVSEVQKIVQLTDFPTSVSQLYLHLLLLTLQRFLGHHKSLSVSESETMVHNLCNYYEKTQEISGHSAQRELKPNDTYLVLAGHILHDLWVSSGHKDEYLLQALSLLCYGLEVSPANHHFKLLMVKFYTLLGCGSGARDIYDTLDVKYVQLDSLSWILCHQLLPLGQIKSVTGVLAQTLRFFSANTRESTEHVISCYKFGTFPKIPEMIDFRKRLENSLQFALATTENMLMNLAFNVHSHSQVLQTAREMEADPDLDRYDPSTLIDNRDLNAMISYDDVSPDEISRIKTETYKIECNYLLLRSNLLHVVIAALAQSPDWPAVHHVTNGTANGLDPKEKLITRLKSDVEQKLGEAKKLEDPKSLYLQSPFRPRLFGLISSKAAELTLKAVDCVENLSDFDEQGHVFEKSANELCLLLQEVRNSQNVKSVIQYDIKEKFYFQIETACLLTSLFNCCNSLLKSQKTKKTKRKKEEAQQQVERITSSTEAYNTLRSQLLEWVENLLEELRLWETSRQEFKIADLASAVTLNGENDITKSCRSKVWEGLLHHAVDDWRVCLNEKVKILKGLSL